MATGPDPVHPAEGRRAPRLPSAAALVLLGAVSGAWGCSTPADPRGEVVFHDDFNQENALVSRANYAGLRQWEVVSGSIDLNGSYPFDLLPSGHGMYIDLDGATFHAATIRTRRALVLEPGDYTLSFMLAGPQRVSAPNTVHLSLGPLFAETFTVRAFDPARTVVRRFRVERRATVRIQFAHDGGDNFGLLVDDVELRRP
jgi:hypothetical protein